LNGSSQNPQLLQDPTGAQLFTVPFKSPTRSGIDWFSAGLDYAIFNQQRDRTKPTWVIGVEGRFGVGTPLHACNANGVTVSDGTTRNCPDPANPTGPDRSPGISRGMIGVAAHTYFSRRFGYIEPYSGLDFLGEFPESGTDFANTNNFQGLLVSHPPYVGSFTMGMEVVPWERREAFQRIIADMRVIGAYHSEGRDYSELFDALGSSQAPSLRNPNPGAYCASGSTTCTPGNADPSAQQDFFTGITDVQAYGSITGRVQATWQAGQYIKFNLGAGFTYNQSHIITAADSCNPNYASDIGAAGPCKTTGPGGSTATGIPNPNHRDVIDLPGRRFSADDTTIVDLWVSGVVMF
jgi:hypothetical protein